MISSLSEFKVLRAYQSLLTVLELIYLRGYKVREPNTLRNCLSGPPLEEMSDRHKELLIETGTAELSGKSVIPSLSDVKISLSYSQFCELFVCADQNSKSAAAGSSSGPKLVNYSAMSIIARERQQQGVEGSQQQRSKRMMVYFASEPDGQQLKQSTVQLVREEAKQRVVDSVLLVSASKIPSSVWKLSSELSGQIVVPALSSASPATAQDLPPRAEFQIRMELFEESDLIVNVLKHDLMPNGLVVYRIGSDALYQLLATLGCRVDQLPRIEAQDPIVRLLGLMRGEVVQFQRPSVTGGDPYNMFRHVT